MNKKISYFFTGIVLFFAIVCVSFFVTLYASVLVVVVRFASAHHWVGFFAPLTLFLLRKSVLWGATKTANNSGCLSTTQEQGEVSPFKLGVGTLLSHFCAVSVGRESVGLRLGSAWGVLLLKSCSKSSFLIKWSVFKNFLSGAENSYAWVKRLFAVVGFTAMFGTPLSAVFFVIESSQRRKFGLLPFVPLIKIKKYKCTYLGEFLLLLLSAVIARTVGRYLLDQPFMKNSHVHAIFSPIPLDALSSQGYFLYFLIGLILSFLALCFREINASFSRAVFSPVFSYAFAFILAAVIVSGYFTLFSNLGEPLFVAAFSSQFLPFFQSSAWAASKTLLTIICLKIGFLGGEFTPLWASGSLFAGSLGNALGLPQVTAAAVGGLFFCLRAMGLLWAAPIMIIEIFGKNCLVPCFFVFLGVTLFEFAYLSLTKRHGE